MSLQHFFLKTQVLSAESSDSISFALDLDKQDLHHAKVLRLSAGEHIGVIDAEGIFYECEICEFIDELKVRISKKIDIEKKYRITLCPGLAKSNKLDDVIRACTEIGISRFLPTQFKRSVAELNAVKSTKKIERWNKIAKSASMQSGQIQIPEIEFVQNVKKLCEKLKNYDCVFVFWEEENNLNIVKEQCEILTQDENNNKEIAIVIGPEGGISQEEIDQLKSSISNCHIASLGDSILRTETANISACSIVKFNLDC